MPAGPGGALEATAHACRLVGWQYRLVDAPDPVLLVNLKWWPVTGRPPNDVPGDRGAVDRGLRRAAGTDGRNREGRGPDRGVADTVPPAVAAGGSPRTWRCCCTPGGRVVQTGPEV